MTFQTINYHIKDIQFNDIQIIDGMLVKDGVGITYNFSLTETDTGAEIIVRSIAKITSDYPTKYVQSNCSITYDYFGDPIADNSKINKSHLTEIIFQQLCRHASFVHIKTQFIMLPISLIEIYESLDYIP